MPYVFRGGVRLHYSLTGAGPPIILQHALTNDHRAFAWIGLRARLEEAGYACLTLDSVAHGQSDTPSEPSRYRWPEQAADVLCMADIAGADRFALVGYSMGAWIGAGVIARAKKGRVAAALLGGWDLIEGAHLFTALTDPHARRREFADTVRSLYMARGAPPPSEARIEGFQRCYAELFAPRPPLAALKAARTAIELFCGDLDPYRPNSIVAGGRLGCPLHILHGDHIAAFVAQEAVDLVVRRLAAVYPASQDHHHPSCAS